MQGKYDHITAGKTLFHLLAFLTVCIWGVTFVSTKTLIGIGLSPTEIFIYRFLIAYLCMVPVTRRRLLADSFTDEALMCLAGLSGGSLYFIAENTALGITFASNVSLLICTAPLLTMLLGRIVLRIPLRRRMLAGSVTALCGVAVVVYNGTFNLGISPAGDLLTMIAALLWAVYCVVLKVVGKRYPTLFITRKVFFYGLLSAGIFILFRPIHFHISLLSQPTVCANLLFLGVLASMVCYVMWNSAVRALGADRTANYIYCVPLVTILTAVIFLSEPLTAFTAAGTALIIGGVFLAER